MSATKILALVKYEPNGASSRVRFWNLRAGLIEKGYEVSIVPLLSNEVLARYYAKRRHSYLAFTWAYLRRIKAVLCADEGSLIWIEKELLFALPLGFERLLGLALSRCVIDYDDAVFLNYRDDGLGVLGRASKFKYYAQNAGHVTVGSDYLLRHMQAFGGTKLTKIPSTVFVERYQKTRDSEGSSATIGWIGTPVTVHFLDVLRPVFIDLAKIVTFRLTVIGAHWECPGVQVTSIPWKEESEAEMVAALDIGIMPLIDGPWERAKCGYKLIQYMAAGVVPVGSSIGENPAIIQDGVNGYLAGNSQEWLSKLSRLCADPALRARLGQNARLKALAQYDVTHAVEAVHQVFGKVQRQLQQNPE